MSSGWLWSPAGEYITWLLYQSLPIDVHCMHHIHLLWFTIKLWLPFSLSLETMFLTVLVFSLHRYLSIRAFHSSLICVAWCTFAHLPLGLVHYALLLLIYLCRYWSPEWSVRQPIGLPAILMWLCAIKRFRHRGPVCKNAGNFLYAIKSPSMSGPSPPSTQFAQFNWCAAIGLLLFAELGGRTKFCDFLYFSTRIAIRSRILVRLSCKYAHSLRNENAEGLTTLDFPDVITIALLGKYLSFCTKLVAPSV
jgi:hypothetical protein